jgi:hypothetical protein
MECSANPITGTDMLRLFLAQKINGVKFRWKRQAFYKSHNCSAILIYTMGKVGSSTIYRQLLAKYPWLPAFQVHFLSDYWIKTIIPKMPGRYQVHLELSEKIKKQLASKSNLRYKIITIIRDPITRDISDIFQNWMDKYKVQSINEVDYSTIVADFNSNDHAYTLDWFDTEFKAFTGIDVYQLNYPKDQSYCSFSFPKFDLLIIKLDTIGTQLTPAVNEFLNLSTAEITGANRSENKEGKELYAQIRTNYKAPKEKLDVVYSSKLIQHFYATDEIAKLRSKWE